jgi:hypothetical protein
MLKPFISKMRNVNYNLVPHIMHPKYHHKTIVKKGKGDCRKLYKYNK